MHVILKLLFEVPPSIVVRIQTQNGTFEKSSMF